MSSFARFLQHPLFSSVASAAVLNLAFAPFNQFYLAWVALAPWLIAVARSGSAWTAAGLGFASGLMFFGIMLHWLWHATIPGTFALLLYLSLYWALAGGVIHRVARLAGVFPGHSATGSVIPLLKFALGAAAVWTTCEWLRGWVFGGFPWASLSQTQVPAVLLCQIAELTGHFGISFWLVLINALIAGLVLTQFRARPVLAGSAVAGSVTLGVVAFGLWRCAEVVPSDGPNILIVQPDFPHARGGARRVTFDQQIRFHFQTTEQALQQASEPVDLIVWSETVLPAMNPEAIRRSTNPAHATELEKRLRDLVQRNNTSLVFGGYALLKLEASRSDADVRNSTYLYAPDALPQRYDKIHLVPFGETVWFKDSIPWLHRLLFKLAAYSVEYVITPGDRAAMTVFSIPCHRRGPGDSSATQRVRFITPICFESINSALVAQMLREPGGGKRADLIVNITNDGWFNRFHKAQNMQMSRLRAVENRLWMVRASNTGISGVIDPAGRLVESLPAGREGVIVRRVGIDPRATPYTRLGNWFPALCAGVSMLMLVGILFGRLR
ncbi:MAG: apolipoprotein N-acyltransferase [Phycisphaerales bacterium]|nr:apolipoprotein N-acyltransferase [Phycisphaerales bacterium]